MPIVTWGDRLLSVGILPQVFVKLLDSSFSVIFLLIIAFEAPVKLPVRTGYFAWVDGILK